MRQKRPYELALLYIYSEIDISVGDIIKRFASMKKLIIQVYKPLQVFFFLCI